MNGKARSVSPFQNCTVDDLIAYRKVAEIIDAKTVTDLGNLAALSSFLYGRTFCFSGTAVIFSCSPFTPIR